MARRPLAFALAFVVIAVPFAIDVCEAVCAEHAGHAIDSVVSAPHHHHPGSQLSHRHDAEAAPVPASERAALKLPPHECGRLDAVGSESQRLTASHIVSAAAAGARFTPLFEHLSPASAMDSRRGPPISTRSASPLRI